MPKITAMEETGNFEVLRWMQNTKKRHAAEDAQAEADGLNLKPRPVALTKAFEKHERHLTRDVYPYAKNPSVHNDSYDIDAVVTKFNDAVLERVHMPILKQYQEKVRAQQMTAKDAEAAIQKDTEPKILSEMELMQLHNLAPTGIETLQLVIEQWEERFSEAEMLQVLDVVAEVLRPDELAAKKAGGQ